MIRPSRLPAAWAALLLAHAQWGLEFYDIASCRVLTSHNGDRLFVPGSTTKVRKEAESWRGAPPEPTL